MSQSCHRRVHLWIPSLFQEQGGIQQYSSAFLQALLAVYPNWCYDVFLKHDQPVNGRTGYQDAATCLNLHGVGYSPLRLRTHVFAAQLFSQGLLQSPDLIISTHLNFTTVAYRLKQVKRIPYWVIAHGIEAWNIEHFGLQQALHQADAILAVSQYTRDRLLKQQQLNSSKVHVLPNTFDEGRFYIAPKPTSLLKKYCLKPEQPVILTVARLSKAEQYKGYDKILAALPQIRQILPDVHYLLVGKGDDRVRIEQLITSSNLQNCVTLAGYVPDEELVDHYNLCDVFAMPSKGEGFGIVYLEAMACGKPVLGGNQDGALDALCQGELGVLINPDDEGAIAQALIQILQRRHSNQLLYQPQNLREQAIAHFGFESFKAGLASHLTQSFMQHQ